MAIECPDCDLLLTLLSRKLNPAEIEYLESLKSDHASFPAGTEIVQAGEGLGCLGTLCTGWAYRQRQLHETKRHIIEVLLPGDLIGLQWRVLGRSSHSVRALTEIHVCVLHGREMKELFDQQPALALDLATWLAEQEARSDHWRTALGRGTATQRTALLMLEVFDRLDYLGHTEGASCPFLLYGQNLSDALGLSRMHVGRTLAELENRELASLQGGRLVIRDRDGLARLCAYDRGYLGSRYLSGA